MTIDIPTRPAPQQAPPAEKRGRRGLKGGPQITFGRQVSKQLLVVGGQPRANLLPPEIILKRKQLKTRRSLRAGVVLIAIVTAAGCVGAFGVSSVAQVALAVTQQQQQALVLEQAQYSEVSQVQQTIRTIVAGQQVGSSTEVDWRSYIVKLQKTLPEGVKITSVKVDTGTPMQLFPQSDAPLQGARVGAISFEASSKTLPDIPDWLRALATMPGFVDATPGSVKIEGSTYTVQVLMHYNTDAYSMRFDPEHVAAAEAEAAAAAASTGEVKSMAPADAVDTASGDGEGN
jgi:Tfp pilus assembly protein PilN